MSEQLLYPNSYTDPHSQVSHPELTEAVHLDNHQQQGEIVPLSAPNEGYPFDRLTSRRQEVATLASSGKTYVEIAEILQLAVPTVRRHLHSAYIALGVPGKNEIPFAMKPDLSSTDDLDFSRLSPRMREMLTHKGNRLTNRQIASNMEISESTVRTYASAGSRLLGIDDGPELTKVAVALAEVRYVAAQGLQQQVVEILDKMQIAAKFGQIQLDQFDARRINNPQLLKELFELGYVSKLGRDMQRVGVAGLVAALLLKKEATHDVLKNAKTADIAKEVIVQETDRLIRQQEVA